MSIKRTQYNPKAHQKALKQCQCAPKRITAAKSIVDTNRDAWIGLPAETTYSGDIIIYRYDWEIKNQPIAGVLIDTFSLTYAYKYSADTVVVKLLDRPGVEYHVPIPDVYRKGIDVETAGEGWWLVLVLLEHLEEVHYTACGGAHDCQ